MTEETIFSKIIRHEIPAKIVYQDEWVTAFEDIEPQAPTHILIIPNKVIPTLNDVTENDGKVLGKLILTASKIAKEKGIAKSGYRLIMNCNEDAGQQVFHIHMHLVGGQNLGPLLAKQ